MTSLAYCVTLTRPETHLFEVRCKLNDPDPAGQVWLLPAWIPGSYLIRDFARHIVSLRAESAGRSVALEKIDKHSWRCAPLPPGQSLQLIYQVYGFDPSVRACYLDTKRAFFNGTSLFLYPQGRLDEACSLSLSPPPDSDWRLATAMQPVEVDAQGFGLYQAADYRELIDHPVEMGCFAEATFSACDVPHRVVVSGHASAGVDLDRLCHDLEKICRWQIQLFGEPAPMPHYLFLIHGVEDGYGGLEHRASTALLCNRDDLPHPLTPEQPDEAYLKLLGLCSHEYFHSWNVKRIHPEVFRHADLQRENYTELLWAFEGFTSYYDDLTLVRCGLIDRERYLELLGKSLSDLARNPGRRRQSVADSSFFAWSKYYRPDENTPNCVVSYYLKGALIALALDLKLRSGKPGHSLDQLMQALWQDYLKTGAGISSESLLARLRQLAGKGIASWLDDTVHGLGDPVDAALLRQFAVELTWETGKPPLWLGWKHGEENGLIKLSHVLNDSPAEKAGLAAGDLLLAWNGLRLTAGNLARMLARIQAGDLVELHYFRRGVLQQTWLKPGAAAADLARLRPAKRAGERALALRSAWLGESRSGMTS
ncbi:MAG: hypothetical protein RIR00_1800 [Pseudomonadota bacterium]|jgi:predicted metalloprotease with PDZ domain